MCHVACETSPGRAAGGHRFEENWSPGFNQRNIVGYSDGRNIPTDEGCPRMTTECLASGIYFFSKSSTVADMAVTPVTIVGSGEGKYSGECSDGGALPDLTNSSIRSREIEPRRNMKIGTPARPNWLKSSPPIDCSTGTTLSSPSTRVNTGTSRLTSASSLRVAGVASENSITGSGAPAPAATAFALRLIASSNDLRTLSV